jgi:hypothetical protein
MFKRLAPGYQLPPICASLVQQVEAWPQAEFLYQSDCGGIPTGTKLRHLTELARGRFISTVDDDDDISDVYVPELLDAIRESPDVDVITFDMHFRVNGGKPRCRTSQRLGVKRPKVHLGNAKTPPTKWCAIRADICRDTPFGDLYLEDQEWRSRILPKLKTEHHIDAVLYEYEYDTASQQRKLSEQGDGGRSPSYGL